MRDREKFLHQEAVRALLSRRITLVDIPYQKFLSSYGNMPDEAREFFASFHDPDSFASDMHQMREEIEDIDRGKGQSVSLGVLVESLIGHFGQLDEDIRFRGMEEVNSTIERIRTLQVWIGKGNLGLLKSLDIVEEMFLDKETDSILLALHSDYQRVTEELNNSEHYYFISERDREEYSYSPMVDSDSLEELKKLGNISQQLRTIRENL